MQPTTLDIIRQRRSHRKYTAQQLTQAQLDAILDAALASPSALNLQPWHFSVVQDAALLNRIHQAAAAFALAQEPDTRSPRYDDPDFQIFYHAPTVIFISAPDDIRMSAVDCGIAVYGIALAAESLGLGSVILGLPRDAFSGPDKAELEQALQFPEGHHLVVSIALGHPADTKDAHEKRPEKITLIR